MGTAWSSFKRAVYLVHRWMGIGACLLMALWFVSGVVMLFIGYPKLTPWERMAHLPALDADQVRIPVAQALARVGEPANATEIVLTSVAGRPAYRVRDGAGRLSVIDAANGQVLPRASPAAAEAAARAWAAASAGTPAREGPPDAAARYVDTVTEDRWTHSSALNPHRPLLRVQLDDDARTLLYISSATGEVVLDAPLSQRAWNYVGAWLHWLYFLRDRPVDPGWSWIVIVLSAGGTIVALTGTLAGIWRWRFRGRYKSGKRSPYRDFYLRWHHITGLVFAAITCTWIFSGLMSMNPLGIFAAQGQRPDVAAYRGGLPGTVRPAVAAADALRALQATGFAPREIAWRVLGGQPYLLARDGADRTRLVMDMVGGGAGGEDKGDADGAGAAAGATASATAGADAGTGNAAPRILAHWPQATLRAAAARLNTAALMDMRWLERYDDYYYGRAPEAMNGGLERRLPAWRLTYADGADTWVYLDPRTGDMALSADRAQRRGRWLFNFLHSWDLPAMLRDDGWRAGVLIVLSLGGLALSLTGVVIGLARLRRKVGRPRALERPRTG
ncbi:PepSY domain-containing protein [Achromobacter aloeverae]|uniref:Peptidase n=1 Tax=Achromobacter aloeverae TaxID=1750518 RepID=A0A4Q1HPS3_9BURK|nr:PepSY domain-containing protein [Achromobacter aloeverae]RXN91554.1 peptidase [Achromobacter aloeverae]